MSAVCGGTDQGAQGAARRRCALTQEEFAAQKNVILEGSAGVTPVQAGVAVPNDGTKNANNTTSNNSIVVQNIMRQGGGRAHKYDASLLSGAWMKENGTCSTPTEPQPLGSLRILEVLAFLCARVLLSKKNAIGAARV